MSSAPVSMEDQQKLLEEALNVVKVQAFQMKKCLVSQQQTYGWLETLFYDASRIADIHMAIFDALRHLTTYLMDAHTSGRHHLADLYELVQYAGNIIPRLYLMITVGSAYMSQRDAPGHSRDREKREMERKELRILVGTNLVRLSQLDGVDLELYQKRVLPAILEQVINCKDVIAQEYLMEVIIQIVIALIDRLAAYAAREADSEPPEVVKQQEEEAARRLAEKLRKQKISGYSDEKDYDDDLLEEEPQEELNNDDLSSNKIKSGEEPTVKKFRGIPEDTRRSVAHAIVSSILKNETIIETPHEVNCILDLCSVLTRDQKDATLSSPFSGLTGGRNTRSSGIPPTMDPEEFAEEQGWLARIIHLFKSDDPDNQYMDDGWEKKANTLFRFVHQVITALYNKVECSELCLRLFLLAGQSADECGFEEICYEFFVQAFTIYEESISESRIQFQAITLIIGTLQTTSVFGPENYDTLITKCALHGSKLLKKPDQCRAVYLSSHLWWATEVEGRNNRPTEELYRDGKRVLECLQKALKIADSCMDSVTNVTVKYLDGLIDLINTNLTNMDSSDQHPPTSASSALIEAEGNLSEFVVRHFKSTLHHLNMRKEAVLASKGQGDIFQQRYDEINTNVSL
ncbi:11533_t:CDS:10 [Racocetra fulgida]|uniref:Vacuolar protein sorting-associated protein 35 n=1 Tax=Racocetra fulgida TaxID=60492 RepID=A0A9N9ASD7_9GLOM|nr:11533_t:CDS:10 [Racocetra fulgida]